MSTIERALAGIAHEHRSRGITWSRGEPAIRETMAGIRRKLGTAPGSKKAPVGDGELAALIATLGEDLVGLRDRALLTLGWSSACRRSELVALDVVDVEFQREGLLVHVRRSKGDREGKGLDKGVPYASAPELCAVRALKAWLERAAITAGPIFRSVDRHGHLSKAASPIAPSRGSSSVGEGGGPRSRALRWALAAVGVHDDRRREGPAARGDHAADRAQDRARRARVHPARDGVREQPGERARLMADGPSVLVTLRLSARDRALLEQLVEHERRELEDLGVEVSLSSVMRKLIRAAAKAPPSRSPRGSLVGRSAGGRIARVDDAGASQDQVRALLRKKMAERRGLGAELARKLGVERAQVSRFKAGTETFPASRLAALYDELRDAPHE